MAMLRFLVALTFGVTLSTTIAFTAGAPTQANSTLVANPNVAVANGAAAITLTFTALDAYSNPAPDVAVSLSASGGNNIFGAASGTTNQSGVFSTTLQSTLAQTQLITASFNAATTTTTVQFVPGPAAASASSLIASPSSAVANNSNTIGVQLTLRDLNGNPIANVVPTFSASGSATTISAALATSASGQSLATYQTTLAQNENAQVVAGGISLATPIVFVAGPVAQATSSLVASPNALPADGATTTTLTTTARDAQGNAVANVAVALSASGSSNTFGATNGNTTAGGVFATNLSSILGQTETITATLNGGSAQSANVAFAQVGNATTSTFAVSPASTVAGPASGNGIVATLTLRDRQSSPIANAALSWAASGTNTIIQASATTNASGVASATYTSTTAQTENASVTAAGMTVTASMTFAPGSPNSLTSVIYSRPSRQLANNSNTIAVYVLLRDAYNNAVPNQAPTFSASGSSTSVVSNGNTNASGVASATYKSSVVQNENAVANFGALSFVQPISFTATPTVCSLGTSTSSATANGNAPITLTATVNGGAGNNTPTSNVIVSFVNSGGPVAFNPSYAVTNGSGVATTTASSLFAGPRTFFATANGVQCTAQGNFIARAPFCPANPTFTVTTLTSSCPTIGIAAGDLNRDGNQDIVTYTNCGVINTYLGAGNGGFSGPTPYSTGYNNTYNSVVLADFNADGYLDVAVSNQLGFNIGVFLGSSTGQLGPQQLFSDASGSIALAAGDVDGDGAIDLIAGSRYASTISVLFGTNTGQFAPYITFPTFQYINETLLIGDFNNDGVSDLTISHIGASPYVSVMLGSTPGAFRAGTGYPLTANVSTGAGIGDFNIDGNLDFVARNTANSYIDMYPGAGNGNFLTRTSILSGGPSETIGVDDLNGDGYPDFVVPDVSHKMVSLLLGAGNGSFSTYANLSSTVATFSPRQVAIADFNNDGRRDFVVSNTSATTFAVFLSSGCN